MTSSAFSAGLPLAAAAAGVTDNDEPDRSGPTVGAADAQADAANSGADADLDDATRDSDGATVGAADRDEDARRSGADTD